MKKKILIVIVVYKKTLTEIELISSINGTEEEHHLFIYDNSPRKQELPKNSTLVTYYHDEDNSGVSRAYNVAFEYAKKNEFQYLLLLDQDSAFKLSYLTKYLTLCDEYGDNYIYAPIVCNGDKIYSPFWDANYVGKIQNKRSFNYSELYSLEGKSLINSGLLVPVKLFYSFGGFNEEIKLDFSDIYFIEKYKAIKADTILVNVELEHSISGDEGKNFNAEMHRFKYYCNGAKLFALSTHKSTLWSCTRRMLRLILKYRSLKPIPTFINYYIRKRII